MKIKNEQKHRAREIVLQLLYELDMRSNIEIEDVISLYDFTGEDEASASYAKTLLRGIGEHSTDIAVMLSENIIGWRLDRMVAVDKAALTLAIYEGFIAHLVPIPVAISEVVELAKAYGTKDSGRFVNGVLGGFAKKEEK